MHEIRNAFRRLVRTRRLAVPIVLLLAVGIGTNGVLLSLAGTLGERRYMGHMVVEGFERREDGSTHNWYGNVVSPGYFATLGIRPGEGAAYAAVAFLVLVLACAASALPAGAAARIDPLASLRQGGES